MKTHQYGWKKPRMKRGLSLRSGLRGSKTRLRWLRSRARSRSLTRVRKTKVQIEAKPMRRESEKQAKKKRTMRCWTAMAIAKCGFWGLEFPFCGESSSLHDCASLSFLRHSSPMSATLYNRKSPAVKRILQEALELQKDPSVEYFARPLEVSSHLLVCYWLCSPSFPYSHKPFAPPRTTFSNGTLPYAALLKRNLTAGGESFCTDCLQYRPASVTACQTHAYAHISFNRYHGRILLPNEYPFKPPELMLLTVCTQATQASSTTQEAFQEKRYGNWEQANETNNTCRRWHFKLNLTHGVVFIFN